MFYLLSFEVDQTHPKSQFLSICYTIIWRLMHSKSLPLDTVCYNKSCIDKQQYLFNHQQYHSLHYQHSIEFIDPTESHHRYMAKYAKQEEQSMQELTKKVEKRIEGIVGRVSAECRKSLMIVFEKAKAEGCKEVKNEGNYSIIIQDLYLCLHEKIKELIHENTRKCERKLEATYETIELKLTQGIRQAANTSILAVEPPLQRLDEQSLMKQSTQKESTKLYLRQLGKQKGIRKQKKSIGKKNLFDKQTPQEVKQQHKQFQPYPSQFLTTQEDVLKLSYGLKKLEHKKLTIFLKTLKKTHILSIINKMPDLNELIINSNNSDEIIKKFIEHMPFRMKRGLRKLQQIWDENQFFKLKEAGVYYPHFWYEDIQPKRYHFDAKIWRSLQSLRNVWVSSDKIMKQIELSENKFADLESLRIEPCRCCSSKLFHEQNVIRYFRHINALKVLIMKYINFSPAFTQLCIDALQRNNGLECLIFESFSNLSYRCLQPLAFSKLKILSIKGKIENLEANKIDVTPVFEIQTLECLTLSNLVFFNIGVHYQRDEEASSIVISNIYNLRNLTHLNFYLSYPVYSDLLDYINPLVNSRLTSLNIGSTMINDQAASKLTRFTNLSELNLERLCIKMSTLQTAYGRPFPNLKKLGLFDFSSTKKPASGIFPAKTYGSIDKKDIPILGQMFPGLQYLDIAYCKVIWDADWSSFRSLKRLCIDKMRMSKVQENELNERGISIYYYDEQYDTD